jgi:hypothetical protein
VKAREEVEAELNGLGWDVTDGPRADVDGWKATITRGALTISATGHGEITVLEDLRHAARRRLGEAS